MKLEARDFGEIFRVTTTDKPVEFLVVCEHASNRIPAALDNLGLSDEAAQSHIAWDPGALGVARALLRDLPAVLVEGAISRLVYDCNRPPEAASAVPECSEIYRIFGNTDLSPADRDRRVRAVYEPFSAAVAEQIGLHRTTLKLMVTVHSFTPVYDGNRRTVEIGVLHGMDDRFAKRMMQNQPGDGAYDIRLNEPYDASDGVAHTLDAQGARNALLNVMIEVRNDLIETPVQQEQMGAYLSRWIGATLLASPVTKGAA